MGLQAKIIAHFEGKVVRKDLSKSVKGNAVVPTYYWGVQRGAAIFHQRRMVGFVGANDWFQRWTFYLSGETDTTVAAHSVLRKQLQFHGIGSQRHGQIAHFFGTLAETDKTAFEQKISRQLMKPSFFYHISHALSSHMHQSCGIYFGLHWYLNCSFFWWQKLH